jgi:hypothetical protein
VPEIRRPSQVRTVTGFDFHSERVDAIFLAYDTPLAVFQLVIIIGSDWEGGCIGLTMMNDEIDGIRECHEGAFAFVAGFLCGWRAVPLLGVAMHR